MGKKNFFVTDGRSYKGKAKKATPGKTGSTSDIKQAKQMLEIGSKVEVKRVEVRCRPLGDRMLVRPLLADEKVGLIIVPNQARMTEEKGEVVAIGPGRFEEPTVLKVGEQVMYNKSTGMKLEIEGEEFIMLRESDALAIL